MSTFKNDVFLLSSINSPQCLKRDGFNLFSLDGRVPQIFSGLEFSSNYFEQWENLLFYDTCFGISRIAQHRIHIK